MRHTVAISDIHLCEAEPGSGLWMRYRQKSYSPDAEIAEMLDALRERVRGDALSVVLNGDIFDFDAPRVVEHESVFHDLPRTAEHAVPMAAAILDDHDEFVAALARVLDEGHSVVFVSGNHDVQMTLPEVREIVRGRLVDAALALRPGAAAVSADVRAELEARVLFRAWFHETPDGIVLEHGNQYDAYCSYRYPMAPFGSLPGEIQPTMGSLATRLLVSRMGYFNPHVDDTFMLSTFGYIAHWARYYLFSRRSLAVAWAVGALRTIATLVLRRDPEKRERRRANIASAVRETGAPMKVVARHARLFERPAEDRLDLVVRELWVDRVGLLGLSVLLLVLAVALLPGLLKLLALLSPVALVVYEVRTPKLPLDETWRRVNRAARRVAKIHKARAVVLGHTHNPEGVWDGDVFYGNTGSWSAAFHDIACTQPLFDERPLVWLTSDDDTRGKLRGGLFSWKDGRFVSRDQGGSPSPRDDGAPRPVSPLGALGPQVCYSVGTDLARTTPGRDAANASAKTPGNPSHSAR
jgi:UDP-2,3-diacylglucosamine pyrophosphatase LpxH